MFSKLEVSKLGMLNIVLFFIGSFSIVLFLFNLLLMKGGGGGVAYPRGGGPCDLIVT